MIRLRVLTSLIAALMVSMGAWASPVCEQQAGSQLTLPQSQSLILFYNQLTALDRYRGTSAYPQKLSQVLASNQSGFKTDKMQEYATEYFFMEQLRQSAFLTIGLNDPTFIEFDRAARGILFFGNLAPRPFARAAAALRKRFTDWASASGNTDAARLRAIAQAEDTVKLLDTVTLNVIHRAENNSRAVDDRLSSYQQYLMTALGASVFFGTLTFSAPVVTTSAAMLGGPGIIFAGCAIGGTGAGSAAVIDAQYQLYSTAFIESYNKGTSFACELRQQEHSGDALLKEVSSAFIAGAKAGCTFTAGSIMAPQVATWTVVSAVSLATIASGAVGANNLYLARKSYLTYQALMAYDKAEAAAREANRKKAEFYLKQSQQLAQKAGASALDTILTGSVIPAFAGGEIVHALHEGRVAIAALVSKSSDNAALAVQFIAKYAGSSPTNPSNVP